MLILSSTISYSVSLQQFSVFVGVLVGYFGFFLLNAFLFKYHEKKTRYKNHHLSVSNKKLFKYMFSFGVIVVPLCKGIIKDARYFIAMEQEIKELAYVVPVNDRETEGKMFYRGIKMMKMKYNKKNFVKRYLFNTFVSRKN